jgi:hypothetical protein
MAGTDVGGRETHTEIRLSIEFSTGITLALK